MAFMKPLGFSDTTIVFWRLAELSILTRGIFRCVRAKGSLATGDDRAITLSSTLCFAYQNLDNSGIIVAFDKPPKNCMSPHCF
ncbi:uncharacterized protein PHALS_03431 [Plasmopara halstedii]|uniref:Uncharacterized protein n=1 Tax=Plasmopara halstedii TaxID=4781 RepID=A0A0N7L7D2_PLAHL|nr:uncharacterized protein PHALS_03431 [Plasmopara halstedii]CEG46747.1 hypothetical protein PHALS_03431 [Plasmopara halstedii]|eukprot:XP_024583116.1 hypothetical protein PHALS_03431 [Plasmopara halstedii]